MDYQLFDCHMLFFQLNPWLGAESVISLRLPTMSFFI